MTHRPHPSAFRPDPTTHEPRPLPPSLEGRGVRVVEVSAGLRPGIPPVGAAPLLTVRIATDEAGRESLAVTLSQPLVRQVAALKGGAPVDIVPPATRGGTWHLDARPTATRRLPAKPGAPARFTSSHKVRRDLFVVARPGGGTAAVLDALTFELGEDVAGGYYALKPRR